MSHMIILNRILNTVKRPSRDRLQDPVPSHTICGIVVKQRRLDTTPRLLVLPLSIIHGPNPKANSHGGMILFVNFCVSVSETSSVVSSVVVEFDGPALQF